MNLIIRDNKIGLEKVINMNMKNSRSRIALARIRESAKKCGSDKMSLSDINAIIKKVRAGKK